MVTLLDDCYHCYTRQTDLSRCDDHFISLSSLEGEKKSLVNGHSCSKYQEGKECMKRKNTYKIIKIL